MPITIQQAITRIPQWTQASSLTVAPLPGGITNFNYRVDVGTETFIVRIAAEHGALLGIDRLREYRCAVAASQTGVAPDVVYFLPDVGVLVTRFIEGRRPSASELGRPEMMQRVVDAMQRFHGGPSFDGSFSPFRTLEQYLGVARRYGAPLPPDVDALFRPLTQLEAALYHGGAAIRPCHNDLWGPNLIDDGARIRIVDWEYAGMGDVTFDLANYAMHQELSDAQDERLLRSYFGEVTARRVARLKLMRIVAELREAMWYMVGMHVSSSAGDFVGSADTHFTRYRHALDDARVPIWLAQAAVGA
jgi:thiamine kinase-like enzyme